MLFTNGIEDDKQAMAEAGMSTLREAAAASDALGRTHPPPWIEPLAWDGSPPNGAAPTFRRRRQGRGNGGQIALPERNHVWGSPYANGLGLGPELPPPGTVSRASGGS